MISIRTRLPFSYPALVHGVATSNEHKQSCVLSIRSNISERQRGVPPLYSPDDSLASFLRNLLHTVQRNLLSFLEPRLSALVLSLFRQGGMNPAKQALADLHKDC